MRNTAGKQATTLHRYPCDPGPSFSPLAPSDPTVTHAIDTSCRKLSTGSIPHKRISAKAFQPLTRAKLQPYSLGGASRFRRHRTTIYTHPHTHSQCTRQINILFGGIFALNYRQLSPRYLFATSSVEDTQHAIAAKEKEAKARRERKEGIDRGKRVDILPKNGATRFGHRMNGMIFHSARKCAVARLANVYAFSSLPPSWCCVFGLGKAVRRGV